jgi:predicted membrane chloride channel (bestrophin family)
MNLKELVAHSRLYTLSSALKTRLLSFILIINYKTFIITSLGLLSTYLCHKYSILANFPDMLIGVAIVFPVVFSIGAAYNRRENALKNLADFKGHAISMYYATRDWPDNKENDIPRRLRDLLKELLKDIRALLRSKKRKDLVVDEKLIYAKFSEVSKLTMELRKVGLQSGEVSRISQYVSKLIIAFDNLLIVHKYRTPITLRAYSKVFIWTFPVIYGPYFANNFKMYAPALYYVIPVLYSFILVGLDNIQDHLENPFDDIGEDDIHFKAKEIIELMDVDLEEPKPAQPESTNLP